MKKFLILIILLLPIDVFAATSTENKISDIIDNLNGIEQQIFLENYPVGSIYMTTNSSENTAAKMASVHGGTWEVYGQGKTLVGYDSNDADFNTINKTGGAKTTTLAVANLPSHTHTISHTHTTPATTISSSGAHTHSTTAKTITSGFTLTAQEAGNHDHRFDQYSNAYAGVTQFIQLGIGTVNTGYGFMHGVGQGIYYGHNKDLSPIDWAGAHTHTVSGSIAIPALSVASSGAHTHTVPAMTTNSQSTTTSGATGSGTAFTNMQPYITVYMYKRTK